MRNGATVSKAEEDDENTPEVNLERVAACRLSPSEGCIVAIEFVEVDVVDADGSGDSGDRG